MEQNTIVTDYNNWTYSLPQDPQQKDYSKLADKLKTYVTSSKFVTQGSTVDQYDPQTGKRIKRPLYDVVYRQNPMSQGISAQELRKKIYRAILSKDKNKLQQASKYRFYSARRSLTPAEVARKLQQEQKQRQRKKRKRVILTAAVLGGAGASAGLLPFIYARKNGQKFTFGELKKSLKLGAAGVGTGILATGLIQAVRG